eukprot:EG_transcript_15830
MSCRQLCKEGESSQGAPGDSGRCLLAGRVPPYVEGGRGRGPRRGWPLQWAAPDWALVRWLSPAWPTCQLKRECGMPIDNPGRPFPFRPGGGKRVGGRQRVANRGHNEGRGVGRGQGPAQLPLPTVRHTKWETDGAAGEAHPAGIETSSWRQATTGIHLGEHPNNAKTTAVGILAAGEKAGGMATAHKPSVGRRNARPRGEGRGLHVGGDVRGTGGEPGGHRAGGRQSSPAQARQSLADLGGAALHVVRHHRGGGRRQQPGLVEEEANIAQHASCTYNDLPRDHQPHAGLEGAAQGLLWGKQLVHKVLACLHCLCQGL